MVLKIRTSNSPLCSGLLSEGGYLTAHDGNNVAIGGAQAFIYDHFVEKLVDVGVIPSIDKD